MSKKFDWDQVDDFLKDLEDYKEEQLIFEKKLTEEVARFYISRNPEYKLDIENYVEICKNEVSYIAADFYDLLGNLLHHYEKETDDFLKMEDLDIPIQENYYTEERIIKLKEDFPTLSEKTMQEFIDEDKEGVDYVNEYTSSFHNIIKRNITEYIFNAESLPARAFRELEYICYDRYDFFEFVLEKKATELQDKKNKVTEND